jgi:2'-5' RNA ligase
VKNPATVEGRARLRLFCALTFPDDVVRALVNWQRETFSATRELRVVSPANLHITLAFLGSRPESDVERIREALADSVVGWRSPPVLRPAAYRETERVGMVVFDDAAGRATSVAEALQKRLEHFGLYTRERRPWLPHVTVIRFRERPRLSPSLPPLGEVSPTAVALFRSVLRPSGAEYEVLEQVALGG